MANCLSDMIRWTNILKTLPHHNTDLQLQVRESTAAFCPQFERQPAQTRQRGKCIREQFGIDWRVAEVLRQPYVSQVHKSSQQYERSLWPVKRQWKNDKIWHSSGEQIKESNEVALTMMTLEHQVSHVTCWPRGTDRLPGVRPFSWSLRPYKLCNPHLMAPWNLHQHTDSSDVTRTVKQLILLIRAVTVPLIPFPVRFGSVFQQKPRFRFGF